MFRGGNDFAFDGERNGENEKVKGVVGERFASKTDTFLAGGEDADAGFVDEGARGVVAGGAHVIDGGDGSGRHTVSGDEGAEEGGELGGKGMDGGRWLGCKGARIGRGFPHMSGKCRSEGSRGRRIRQGERRSRYSGSWGWRGIRMKKEGYGFSLRRSES